MKNNLNNNDNFDKIIQKLTKNFIIDHSPNCSAEFFIEQSFYELNKNAHYVQNWHIKAMAKLLHKIKQGQLHKLIITLPPRYMKSHCITVAFTAWMLGLYPEKKIITASYNQQLSNNFLSQVKCVIKSGWYKIMFPNTKLLLGSSLKNKLLTTQNGFRFSTSIAGTLTGEGADILIADDPHKPLDIQNKNSRKKVHEWFENTFSSRLNDKKNGVIIIIMQRLHEDDLVGYLLSKPNAKQWAVLNLELQSTKNQLIQIDDFKYFRPKNEPLHKQRQDQKQIEELKEDVGEYVFNSQYQQNPISKDGKIIKSSWIKQYSEDIDSITDEDPSVSRRYFISIDCAIKSSSSNDYTAITIWYCRINEPCFYNNQNTNDKQDDVLMIEDKISTRHPIYLQNVINQKLSYPQILVLICDLIKKYKPEAIVIEDAASGSQLIQQLQNVITTPIFGKIPTRGKQTRLTFASLFFEKRLVNINLKMPEFYTTINQLTNFPSVKNDDICDSISMFVNWFYDFYESDIQKSFMVKDSSKKVSIRML